jgi:hypothetical protein
MIFPDAISQSLHNHFRPSSLKYQITSYHLIISSILYTPPYLHPYIHPPLHPHIYTLLNTPLHRNTPTPRPRPQPLHLPLRPPPHIHQRINNNRQQRSPHLHNPRIPTNILHATKPAKIHILIKLLLNCPRTRTARPAPQIVALAVFVPFTSIQCGCDAPDNQVG